MEGKGRFPRRPASGTQAKATLLGMTGFASFFRQGAKSVFVSFFWFRISFFELLNVALFDLLHKGFAFEEVSAQVGGELLRDDKELVVGDLREGDGAARRNQMRSPLENEAGVPEDEKDDDGSGRGEHEAGGMEQACNALEEQRQAKNENWREGNEVPVSKRSHAMPVRVASD